MPLQEPRTRPTRQGLPNKRTNDQWTRKGRPERECTPLTPYMHKYILNYINKYLVHPGKSRGLIYNIVKHSSRLVQANFVYKRTKKAQQKLLSVCQSPSRLFFFVYPFLLHRGSKPVSLENSSFPDSTRRGNNGNGDTTTNSRCTNFYTF